MKTLAVALSALVLALPGFAHAQPSEPDYPQEFLALLPGWIAEAEALASEADKEKPWYAEADGFLQKARAAEDAGRFRIALFDIETYRELVIAHQLNETSQSEGSDAERRTFIASRTGAVSGDVDRAWEGFRASLHGYDGQIRSLQTIEKALYASDVALVGILGASEYDAYARDFPKQGGVPFAYIHALVRATYTPLANLEWAQDMLAEAVKGEGLPPRVLDEPWTNISNAAITVPEGDPIEYLKTLDEISKPARANREVLLSLSAALAEQRSHRAYGMQTIFGDAGTRGLDVVRDAARGMNKQLNNTTLETPRSYGLQGVFTSDAIDRAAFTNEFLDIQKADLGTVIVAWSGLEHANYVLATLSTASPVQPEPQEAETPSAGVMLSIVAVCAVALASRRRR